MTAAESAFYFLFSILLYFYIFVNWATYKCIYWIKIFESKISNLIGYSTQKWPSIIKHSSLQRAGLLSFCFSFQWLGITNSDDFKYNQAEVRNKLWSYTCSFSFINILLHFVLVYSIPDGTYAMYVWSECKGIKQHSTAVLLMHR